MSTLNCQSCRKLDAALADMRVRLQKAHGAMYTLRHPDDGASPETPRDTWQWNPNGMAALMAAYTSLPALLEQTRPDAASGVEILDELRRTKEALEAALKVLRWYASQENYEESCDMCAGEAINKESVEYTWIPDCGQRARDALKTITGEDSSL